jgi:hypothetical protein
MVIAAIPIEKYGDGRLPMSNLRFSGAGQVD